MFVYCNNNPSNFFDPNGFRLMRFDGEEIDYSSTSIVHKGADKLLELSGTKVGQTVSNVADVALGGYIAKKAMENLSNSWKSRVTALFDKVPLYQFPKVSKTLKALNTGAKYGAGIISIFTTSLSIWSNFSHYDAKTALFRSSIDLLSMGLNMGVGVITAPLGVVGVGISIGVSMKISEIADDIKRR